MRRKLVIAGVGLALALIAGGLAIPLFQSPSEPPSVLGAPVLGFVSGTPATSTTASYVVDLRLVAHSCSNPVHVTAIVSYPSEFWKRSTRIGPTTPVSFAFGGFTPSNVRVVSVPLGADSLVFQSPHSPAISLLYPDVSHAYRQDSTHEVSLGLTDPNLVPLTLTTGTMTHLADTLRRPGAHLRRTISPTPKLRDMLFAHTSCRQ